MSKRQIFTVPDVRAWADRIIPGIKVPADAEYQLAHPKGIREARNFQTFKEQLRIYKNASEHIFRAYEAERKQELTVAHGQDFARAFENNKTASPFNPQGDQNIIHLKSATPIIIPIQILYKLSKIYANALKDVDSGQLNEKSYTISKIGEDYIGPYKPFFLDILEKDPGKIRAQAEAPSRSR